MKSPFLPVLVLLGLLSGSAHGRPINDSILAIIRGIDSVRMVYFDNAVVDAIVEEYGWDSDEMKELSRNKNRIDSIQLPIILDLIDRHGYPGRSTVGTDHENVAFLVLKNGELSVIKRYLPIIEQAADDEELEWKMVARLIDRIRILEGNGQLYGTHLIRNKGTNTWRLAEIEDEECVDQRRREIGLEPLADHVKPFGVNYVSVGVCKATPLQKKDRPRR